MPRGFTEQEKSSIRAALIGKGRELFTLYGLKKTSIDDLARAAGISKGAFYIFYDSKEALLIEIIEQFEAAYFNRVLQSIAGVGAAGREEIAGVLKRMVIDWQTDPMFKHMGREDLELLMRKLPPEKTQAALLDDVAFAEQMIAAWSEVGLDIACGPEMLASLLRALFFVNLHQEDFVAAVYPAMIDALIGLVAGYLTGGR
ncbi:MAG TPA: TetR/AcrR family transcriptional regulator [Herpetosiphonaceae bacterium]|nr:TetR/AcrR family transcriptional regulator [Herpetosiphonaceae bacterium]